MRELVGPLVLQARALRKMEWCRKSKEDMRELESKEVEEIGGILDEETPVEVFGVDDDADVILCVAYPVVR